MDRRSRLPRRILLADAHAKDARWLPDALRSWPSWIVTGSFDRADAGVPVALQVSRVDLDRTSSAHSGVRKADFMDGKSNSSVRLPQPGGSRIASNLRPPHRFGCEPGGSAVARSRQLARARLDDLRSRPGAGAPQSDAGNRISVSGNPPGSGCIPGCYFEQVSLKLTDQSRLIACRAGGGLY